MTRRRYQNGRVFLRGKKPVWVGRYREDVIGQDGKMRRVERSVRLGTKRELPTKKLALRRMDLVLVRVNGPGYRPCRVATMDDFVERWKGEVLVHKKPSTQRAASSHIRAHIIPVLGRLRVDEVGPEVQQAFITHLAKGRSRKTVLNVVGTLGVILATAKRWGYSVETLELRELAVPCGEPGKPARFFSVEETRAVISAAPQPYRTMFLMAAMAGLRVGELLGLQVADLDFERRLVCIRRSVWHGQVQTVKSRASKAVLPMPEPMAAALREYLQGWTPNEAGLLFVNRLGRPYSANKVVQKSLWPVLDKLGIPRCGMHAFRHTHSSLLLEVGAPASVAQAQLRHSDPRITLGLYSHVLGDSQRVHVERVAELLRPAAPKSETVGEWIQ